jgi:hypothetical protein
MEDIDKFHEHLDACAQCRVYPFQLCSTGAQLLEKAAGAGSRALARLLHH